MLYGSHPPWTRNKATNTPLTHGRSLKLKPVIAPFLCSIKQKVSRFNDLQNPKYENQLSENPRTSGNHCHRQYIYWMITTIALLDHIPQSCDNLCSPFRKWGHRFFKKEIRNDNFGSSQEVVNKSTWEHKKSHHSHKTPQNNEPNTKIS